MPPVDTTSVDISTEQIAMYSSSSGAWSGGFLVAQVAFYVLIAYSLFTLAKKLGEQYTWMAWVPVLNIVLMLRMANMSLWWLLGFFVPLFNIYVYVKVFHNGISKRTWHGGWWTVWLVFLGFIFLPMTAFQYQSSTSWTNPTAPTV